MERRSTRAPVLAVIQPNTSVEVLSREDGSVLGAGAGRLGSRLGAGRVDSRRSAGPGRPVGSEQPASGCQNRHGQASERPGRRLRWSLNRRAGPPAVSRRGPGGQSGRPTDDRGARADATGGCRRGSQARQRHRTNQHGNRDRGKDRKLGRGAAGARRERVRPWRVAWRLVPASRAARQRRVRLPLGQRAPGVWRLGGPDDRRPRDSGHVVCGPRSEDPHRGLLGRVPAGPRQERVGGRPLQR